MSEAVECYCLAIFGGEAGVVAVEADVPHAPLLLGECFGCDRILTLLDLHSFLALGPNDPVGRGPESSPVLALADVVVFRLGQGIADGEDGGTQQERRDECVAIIFTSCFRI